MDAVTAAREMLPAWVGWGNAICYPALAFAATLTAAGAGTLFAAFTARRLAADAPWTERARRLFAVQLVANAVALAGPLAAAALAHFYCGPFDHLPAGALGLLGGAAAFAAGTLVRWRVARRLGLAEGGRRRWLRGVVGDLLIRHSYLFILFLMLALVGDRAEAASVLALAVSVALFAFFAWGGGLFLARLLGVARPADERLLKVVAAAAARTGVRPRGCCVIASTMVNAWAFPLNKRLAFSESILAALDDEELTAVSAHELGHLTEPTRIIVGRMASLPLLAALGASRLIVAVAGPLTLLLLVAALFVVSLLLGRLSRRMERRADQIGGREDDGGAYARALEKIYRANLLPAVFGGRLNTHPHLYDRLVAAGTPPAYERPRPPSSWVIVTALVIAIYLMIGGLAAPFAYLRSTAGSERELLVALAVGGGTFECSRLAYLHWENGDAEGAVTLYRAAAELDRRDVYAPANLAIVLAAMGRCDEAREAAREAVARIRREAPDQEVRLIRTAYEATSRCRGRQPAPADAAHDPHEDTPEW